MSKKNAAKVVADLMMAHYDGPFDDNAFYDDLLDGEGTKKDQKGAEYFDESKHELHDDKEFRELVVEAVRKNLS